MWILITFWYLQTLLTELWINLCNIPLSQEFGDVGNRCHLRDRKEVLSQLEQIVEVPVFMGFHNVVRIFIVIYNFLYI